MPKQTGDTPHPFSSSFGLKTFVGDQLLKLDAGAITPQQARAVSSLANVMLGTTRLEMDYARFISDQRRQQKSGGDGLISLNPIGLIGAD